MRCITVGGHGGREDAAVVGEEGVGEAMATTNALGMKVDIPDVRMVVRADGGSCVDTAAVASLWTRERAGRAGWGSGPGGGDLVGA